MAEQKYYLLRKDEAFKDALRFTHKSVLKKYDDEDYIYIQYSSDASEAILVVYFYDENNKPCQVLDSINDESEVKYICSACREYYQYIKESLDELRKQPAYENFPFFFIQSSEKKMKIELNYLLRRAKEAIAIKNQLIKQL